jgi:antitoxin MazE
VKGRIVRIGTSRGIRIPRPLLDQSGLAGEVVLDAAPGRIVIESAARAMAARGDDAPLDAPTRFDDEE